MGADGGLIWMELKNPAKRERVMDLISPLGFFDYKLRDEDNEWLRNNKEPYGGKAIMGRYGTDIDSASLYDLQEMLAEIEPGDARTFDDVVLDIATRPESGIFWEHLRTDQLILRAAAYSTWAWYQYPPYGWNKDTLLALREADRLAMATNPRTKDNLGILWGMRLQDWAAELKAALHWDKYLYSVETWT